MSDYEWGEVCVLNSDGTMSGADKYGNEIVILSDGKCRIIRNGFANPLGLKFVDGDGLEFMIMREIEQSYYLDELGLDGSSFVIDIGAHVGVVSMTMAKKYGCKVYAYEPAPNNYRRLVENVKLNGLDGLVIAHNLAVTRDGREVVVGGPGEKSSGGMCIYPGLYKTPGTPFTPVQSVTLAQIMDGRDVDLLKIDCEGAEYEVLTADLDVLQHVKALRGEFHSMTASGPNGTMEVKSSDFLEYIKQFIPNAKVSL